MRHIYLEEIRKNSNCFTCFTSSINNNACRHDGRELSEAFPEKILVFVFILSRYIHD